MEITLKITNTEIDPAALAQRPIRAGETGALITFQGIVRATEGSEPIVGIDYEAFPEMAEKQFKNIFDEAAARWPIQSIRLIHRIGYVPINEPSLWVEITAPHRGEAFAACQYIIDEMKQRVPIWKHPRAARPA
jgi:molybdopterin synthase catalytic subunit